jgi:hypothetical protein
MENALKACRTCRYSERHEEGMYCWLRMKYREKVCSDWEREVGTDDDEPGGEVEGE